MHLKLVATGSQQAMTREELVAELYRINAGRHVIRIEFAGGLFDHPDRARSRLVALLDTCMPFGKELSALEGEAVQFAENKYAIRAAARQGGFTAELIFRCSATNDFRPDGPLMLVMSEGFVSRFHWR